MAERAIASTSRVRCTQVCRVSGRACGAQRVLALSNFCLVCGGATYERVLPSRGDIPGLYAELARLATDLVGVDPTPANQAIVSAVAQAVAEFHHAAAAPVHDRRRA